LYTHLACSVSVAIVDAKAHRFGYLYLPPDCAQGDPESLSRSALDTRHIDAIPWLVVRYSGQVGESFRAPLAPLSMFVAN
jgi:hypothetical protein